MIAKMVQISRTLTGMDAVGLVTGHLNSWIHRNRVVPIRSTTKSCNHIEVDLADGQMGYEIKKSRYFSLPFLWALTAWVFFKKRVLGLTCKTNSFWFDGLSPAGNELKTQATSWRALHAVYNHRFRPNTTFADNYWLGMINAQAVRNRLRLVKRELKTMIGQLADNDEEVRILSIASGSSQAVLEALKETEEIKKEPLSFKATLLDIDPTALEYSRQLAETYGFNGRITYLNRNTKNLKQVVTIRPNIIEMVGFLDYRPEVKAVRLIKTIHDLLLPGGNFITANICPNQEKHFVKWVIDWPMIYRTPEKLWNIITEAGFKKCRVIVEPQRLHAVAICLKSLE